MASIFFNHRHWKPKRRRAAIKETETKIITRLTTSLCTTLLGGGMMSVQAQDSLPFPDPPMGGKVGPTMQESVHKWREEPSRLPADAPNIQGEPL
jgi:hypothetical protein